MMKKDLSKYELSRFTNNCECRICGTKIYDDEPFEMIKQKKGRATEYGFIHTICVFQPKRRFSFGDILELMERDRELLSD